MPVTQKFVGDTAQLMAEYQKILAQQAKLEQALQDSANKQKEAARAQMGLAGAIEQQNKRGVQTILSAAAAYVSVQGAINLASAGIGQMNQMLGEQKATYQEIAELQKNIARAQSDAVKNFAGLQTVQKQETLDEIKRIALRTGFSDESMLVQAVGAGVSAGATAQQALASAEAAAQLTRVTPDQLPVFSGAAVDLARGTGVTDPQQLLGFLLQTGAVNRATDPAFLAKNLPNVVNNATAMVPSELRQETARQAAAIFSTLTKAGTDVTGDSSNTAATQFMGRMEKFFGGGELDKSIAQLNDKLADPELKAERADELQAELADLRKQRAALDQVGKTPFEQLAALQQNAGMRADFFSEDFGEERFKKFFRAFAMPDSTLAAEARGYRDQITFGVDEFRQQAAETRSATRELFTATASSELEAVINNAQSTSGAGLRQTVADLTSKALQQNRSPDAGLEATGQMMDENLFRFNARIRSQSTDQAAFQKAQEFIQFRLDQLASQMDDPLTALTMRGRSEEDRRAYMNQFNDAIENLQRFNETLAKLRAEAEQAGRRGAAPAPGAAAIQTNQQTER
jgi:hypothetical protein